ERPRKRGNFVAAAIRSARGHVAGAEPDRCRLQLLQTATCGTEHEQRDQYRTDDEHRSSNERHCRSQLADDHADWRTTEQNRHGADRLAIQEHGGEFTETEWR